MTIHRAFSAGHFELAIDGDNTTSYLKSVDGGYIRNAVIDEPIGPENHRIKHHAHAEIEPITVDFGISAADPTLRWIQQSWRKNFSRRDGQISHGNFDL